MRWLLHEVERQEFEDTNEFLCDRNPVLQDSLSAIQRKVRAGERWRAVHGDGW